MREELSPLAQIERELTRHDPDRVLLTSQVIRGVQQAGQRGRTAREVAEAIYGPNAGSQRTAKVAAVGRLRQLRSVQAGVTVTGMAI